MRDLQVAVVYNADGTCKSLAKVKVVNQQEYNKLLNEKSKFEQEKTKKENDYKDYTAKLIEKHNDRLLHLESKTLILAKSIYDNFVDRGLIENDDAFQQAWYDYYFNDKELEIEQYPIEFSKILEKVR